MASDCENGKSPAESDKSTTWTDSEYFHGVGKHRFDRYFERATIHWLRKSCSGKSYIRRFCWIVFFLCVLVVFLQGVIRTILLYSSTPTATTVYTDPVDSLIFPSVTLCNINGFNLTYLEERNLTEIVDTAIYFKDTREKHSNCDVLVPENYPINETLYKIVSQSSQSLDNFIQDCHFLGQKCNNSMFEEYLTPTGRCFVFNGGKSKNKSEYLTLSGTGFRNDLELLLNVESETFVGSVNSEVGVLASVHEPGSSGLVWETGMHVPLRHSAYIAVENRQIEDRTERMATNNQAECIHEINAPVFEYFTGYNYSYRSCRADCIYNYTVNKCRCWFSKKNNITHSNITRDCNIADLCCIYNVLKFTSPCNCSKLCNRTEYEVTPNYSTFPSLKGIKKLESTYNITKEKVLNDLLQVHVYYKSLTIRREITVRSFSFNKLLSLIGGHMGLYLGASIFSLVELIILLVDYFKDRFKISEKNIVKIIKSCWKSLKGKCFKLRLKVFDPTRKRRISVNNTSVMELLSDNEKNC